MRASSTLGRRRFLAGSAGSAAALIAAPAIEPLIFAERAAAADAAGGGAVSPFVEYYTTNVPAHLSSADNAAVRILAGMARLWAIEGLVRLEGESALRIDVAACDVRRGDRTFHVIDACDLRGAFRDITVSAPGFRAEPRYSASGLTVRIRSSH